MYINIRLRIKQLFTVLFFLFSAFISNAQLATYPMRTGGGNPAGGQPLPSGTNLNITAGSTTVGSEITTQPGGTYNSTGLRVRPNNLAWPTSISNSFCVNIPLAPKPNYDFNLTSVTFKNNALDGSPNLWCQLSYEVNGSGIYNLIGTPQAVTAANLASTISIAGLNEGFYNNNLYVFRFYFYGNGANDKSQGFRMSDLVFNGVMVSPPSIAPIVITGSLGSPTKYSNTVSASSYTISNGGVNVKVVNKSGVCYGTSTAPTILNSSYTVDAATNGVATATFNSTLSGLTPNTKYYVRAYALTQVDTVYGSIASFTTLPQTVPTLNTNSPINILSNKATTGGNTIDSGGYPILEKGILYDVNNSLVYPGTNHSSDGIGNANFTSVLKNLLPNTKYYIMAYARNSLGVGYANIDSFTTSAPVPSITVNPSNLDFGDITYNATGPVLSYRLNATYLTPTAGSITLNASTGYTICATLNGAYQGSLVLNYTGSTIINKVIYVKSASTPYGPLSGKILHIGGGTVAPNADTTFLITNVIQNPDTLSNSGSDFWCGFGYQEKMSQVSGNSGEAKLSIYITTGNQPATVHVDLTSGGYSKTQTIPANSYYEFNNFPTGDAGNKYNPTGLPDSRLYATGITQKSIHIYSDNGVPVSAFMHSYTNSNTAAGAMLFPSNTWNSNYTVQAFGGQSNSSNPSSYFFVIANQDNTPITFTPKNDIVDSNSNTIFSDGHTASDIKYKKDSTYTVVINKGQVFNAMGFVSGSGSGVGTGKATGLDLSGTSVKTTCDKKITVFAGNGRCLISGLTGTKTTGSDHLIQQMFPSVAWGTKYLTMPTKGEPLNYYRIYIQNPALYGATKVWVNNPAHTTPLNVLVNNLYYEYESNQPLLIESDKPINVTQFITTPYSSTPSVDGGPEMVMLSPVQQSITKATVFSAAGKDGSASQTNTAGTSGNHASFLNVIIPTSAVSSFRLDNSNLVDTGRQVTGACPSGNTGNCSDLYAKGTKVDVSLAFRKHPQDTSYSIANLWVLAPSVHTMSASKGFNSIAYGLGVGESYGYNAGTTINNLSAIKFSLNPYGTDTSTASVKTCKGNLVTLQIALPYDTTTVNSIIWDPGTDGSLYSPTGPQAGQINPSTTKPQVVGTIVRDGRTFYIYKSPAQYTFFEEGAYKVKVTINGTFASDCGGTDIQYMNVIVGHDDISFTATPAGCGSKNVTIADATTPLAGTSIVKWNWDFGDNTKDSALIGDSWAPNPKINPHTYPNNNAFTIKLTTINSVGCFSTDSVSIDLAFGISTSFTSFRDTACVGENVVFTPTSSANAVKWFWDFGDSSPIDSSNTSANSISHSYSTAGGYVVSHWVKTAAGCPSAIVKDTIEVSKTPVASFVLPAGVCLPGNTQFTNSSDTSAAGAAIPYTYHWSFGTGNAADTSNVKNPVFAYTTTPPSGGYPVKLTATSRFGCTSSVFTEYVNNVFTKPTAVIANSSSKKVCMGNGASFYDGSFGTNQTVNSWYWNFGDAATSSSQNPTHTYTNNLLYTVKLAIGTDKGCVSDTTIWSIKVNPKPVAATILPSSCITSGSLLFQDNSTVATDDSTQTPYTYFWTFGDGSGTYTTKDSTHTYAGIGTYYINHGITTVNGCTDKKIDTFTISGSKPVPLHQVPNPNLVGSIQYCSNQNVYLRDSSSIALGTIKKVEIYWDIDNVYLAGLNTNPTVDNTPQNGVMPITTKVYSFKYPYSATSKSVKIRIVNYNDNNCYSSDTISLTVYGTPIVKFDNINGICLNGAPKKINFAYDSTGRFDASNYIRLAKKPTYSGLGVYNDSMFNPVVADTGIHIIKCVYETNLPFNNHCIDSGFASIRVWALPTVKFDTALIKCEGNSISFTDQSIAGSGTGNIKSWLWNFGNPSSGTNDTSSIKNPSHTYNTFNTYSVTLKVTSDSGCSNTSTPKIITINPKPKVGFISPAGTCAGTPVGFTDTSKIADGTQGLFTHFWNFGDPASGTNNTAIGTPLPNPSHLYATTPPDSVKLIVTSNNSCVDSFAVKLSSSIFPKQHATYIANGKPKDNTDITRVCLGNSIKFASGLAANNTYWIFGDSGILVNTNASPTHTYPTVNSFTGQFYADDIHGCRTDTVAVKVEIWALPTPTIQVTAPTCEKQISIFTDKSTAGAGTGNINFWLWNFGDPISGSLDSSKQQNPLHYYSAYGNYNVNLTVTSDSGCKATTTAATVVNVHPKPKVTFVLPSSVCLPLAAQFTDTSKIADGTESQFSHVWDFGDITSGVNNIAIGNPLTITSHIFSSSNDYKIKLTVRSADGCIDSSTQTLLASAIHNKPHADYIVNTINKDTPTVCLGTTITFKDASVGTVKSYWIWGDEGLTTYLGNTPPPHLFSLAGSYYGIHFIDNNFGCRSDTADFLTIIDSFPVIVGGEKYIQTGTSAYLTPYISGAATVLWTPVVPAGLVNNYLDYNDVESPFCTPLDSVIYRIDAKSQGGCAAPPVYYAVKLFSEPNIPNVFSPNGDGINDSWDITSLQYFNGATVQVFNRWGQLVFNSLGYSKPWKGTDVAGKPLPEGVYYYIIKLNGRAQPKSGSITILR